MQKSRLYTATGDSGTTSLVGGERIRKDSVRLEAYGTIDEFSSFLGVVLSMPECEKDIRGQLLKVQNMLFNLGGYLATLPAPGERPAAWGLNEKNIEEVESWIDTLDDATPKANSFVLPGGTLTAAHCHVARTVCRRCERRILRLATEEYVDPLLLKYINRLSDYLFILARYFNHRSGMEEIKWEKDL